MMPFGIYRLRGDRKGEIIRFGSSEPFVIALQLQEDEKADFGLASGDVRSPTLDYVNDDGEIIAKPVMPATIDKTQIVADDTDTATISGLPAGTVLFVNGGEYPISGDKVALTLDRPATVEIVAKCWPYVDITFVLDAD